MLAFTEEVPGAEADVREGDLGEAICPQLFGGVGTQCRKRRGKTADWRAGVIVRAVDEQNWPIFEGWEKRKKDESI